jgi:DNA repair protein RadC
MQAGYRKSTGMVSKALIKEAAELLPLLPGTNFPEVRKFIENNLRFNSTVTRERYTTYITKYLFPRNIVDDEILLFSRKVSIQSIKNVCLYRFCKSYPLIYQLFKDLLIPNINSGQIVRKNIDLYLLNKFPNSSPGRFGGRGFIEALSDANVIKTERGLIKYGFRSIDLPSFAFMIYSEFSKPGIYNISNVEDNEVFLAQLWKKTDLLNSLYVLRDNNHLSKVSEIDDVRQFSIKYDLKKLIENI